MHRTAPRLARILACAAVPVMFLAAGCGGSDSGSDSGSGSSDEGKKAATPATGSTPTVAAAKFGALPPVCDSLSAKTVEKLVPGTDHKKGKALPAADINEAASCLWAGLDGYQYRSLTLSLKRFDSDPALGSGDDRAKKYAADQADKARVADGAKDSQTGEGAIADSAVTVRTKSKKDGVDFRNQTVVVRTANVVITVEYDGAGYEDAKTPDAAKLLDQAEDAAKEVAESIAKTGEGKDDGSGSSSGQSDSTTGGGSKTGDADSKSGDADSKSGDTSSGKGSSPKH
ncbi:hypothetical protein [Streptomyces palmae]|uniref:DUF3558 domain-containing protein n=1 Tax=Streptomyces palmae TaxID=1701085 RepID=A0A4Z0HAK2_9ACTN|nr:hypothetical protein [Streptomyces palmae]TGB15299.1 hypothetical protein E4099_07015 [Streptomyces palmae]